MKYSIQWAQDRVTQHYQSHTRATTLLHQHFYISAKMLAVWLASGESGWEYWKFLTRMVENAWNIRSIPNTTTRLDSKYPCRALTLILSNDVANQPQYHLTWSAQFAKLKKHCVCGEAASAVRDYEKPSYDDGQLSLL
jgi:hypothetical protein